MPSGIAALLCAGRLFCIALAFCPNLRYAERKARVSSDDFKKCQEITITEIDMNEEQCVLTANTGA